MFARMRHTLGPLIGYHGCDRSVAEAVLAGTTELRPSLNEYDWLGSGIYFWVDSPDRGLDWACQLSRRKNSQVKDPYVLGALIYPNLCLNLCDFGIIPELLMGYRLLEDSVIATGMPMPQNSVPVNEILLRRPLDCSVINVVHALREETNATPYDTVYGFFEEGPRVYPTSGFRAKTHVQIAVRNTECIVGYFRVKGF